MTISSQSCLCDISRIETVVIGFFVSRYKVSKA